MIIWSGGQTGADQGALIGASRVEGVVTGGWAPLKYRTLDGPNPRLKEFGLKEATSIDYPTRTELNVKETDATLRFAAWWGSPGEMCTQRYIGQYRKPYLNIDFKNPMPVERVVRWIKDGGYQRINVAGNSEQTAPGIQVFVADYLEKVLRML